MAAKVFTNGWPPVYWANMPVLEDESFQRPDDPVPPPIEIERALADEAAGPTDDHDGHSADTRPPRR
jgi:hypothetical protein